MTNPMSLKAYLDSFSTQGAYPFDEYSRRVGELNTLIESTKVSTEITFWGARIVTVKNQTVDFKKSAGQGLAMPTTPCTIFGSISLDEVAEKTLHIFKAKKTTQDGTPDRSYLQGKAKTTAEEAVKRIYTLYKATDDHIQKCSFLTQFFTWIREFCFWPSLTPRYQIETLNREITRV